jgi:hypothetical protein
VLVSILVVLLSCGGGTSEDICSCSPSQSASSDYRHDAKHVPLPAGSPQEISVATMLSWPQGAEPPGDAARSGRELQLFHISRAFVQFVWLFHGDCDVHLEISDTPAKTAPRAIVEVPVDQEYCLSRKALQIQLARNGIRIRTDFQEIARPLPAEVLGLAFHDFHHKRGSSFVATVWELHPAVVQLNQ